MRRRGRSQFSFLILSFRIRLQPVRNLLFAFRRGWPQSAARSSHNRLSRSMRATFFSRRHFLISVSLAIALLTY